MKSKSKKKAAPQKTKAGSIIGGALMLAAAITLTANFDYISSGLEPKMLKASILEVESVAVEEESPIIEETKPAPQRPTCEPFFDEKQEPKDLAEISRVVKKLRAALDQEFKDGKITFLSHANIEAELEPCEADLFRQVSELDPSVWGINFPKYTDESREPSFYDEIPAPEPLKHRVATNYLPQHISERFHAMMDAMDADIGRRLYIESGYRSPQLQAWLFLENLTQSKNMKRTARFVALPYRSEHGLFESGAVDVITIDGISDQQDGARLTSRAEYKWLKQNAMRFGFYETFEINSRYGHAFEPWHWHYAEWGDTVGELPVPQGATRIPAVDEWGEFIENLPLKPQGDRTMMLYRRENRKDGSEFINSFSNYIYEDIIQTMAVVDIPVSAHQDCSKQMVRLLALFADSVGKAGFSFPFDGVWTSFADFQKGNPNAELEDFITQVMVSTGTISWRRILREVPPEEMRVGDLIIQPQVSMEVDPIYGEGAVIGHTGVVAGLAEDKNGHRYFLVGSGSLPITDFRISKANNGWQGWDGWFDVKGYLHRVHGTEVEFYRMGEFVEEALAK